MFSAASRRAGAALRLAAPPRVRSLCKPSYSEIMDKTGRPISPHLMIYRLPAIAWSSVTVRITGAIASFGFFGVAGAALYKGGDWVGDNLVNFGAATQSVIGTDLTVPAKLSVAFVLSYQWFGSVRHAYWDVTAKGFHNTTMLQSSYALIGTTTLLSLALAMYSLPPPAKSETN
jgi:succinate dehydrogenase/fumarate reductase cytochrome b subunit